MSIQRTNEYVGVEQPSKSGSVFAIFSIKTLVFLWKFSHFPAQNALNVVKHFPESSRGWGRDETKWQEGKGIGRAEGKGEEMEGEKEGKGREGKAAHPNF